MKKLLSLFVLFTVLAVPVLAGMSFIDSENVPLQYAEAMPVKDVSFRDSTTYLVVLSVLIVILAFVFLALVAELLKKRD